MPNITVNTDAVLGIGETLDYRYQKISTGTWSSWFTTNTSNFTFTTADPVNTNYNIEVIKQCVLGSSGKSNTFTTNFSCPCNVINVYNATPSACNPADNTHSVTFLVDYNCMKNDIGLITSVFRVEIDGVVTFVNPTSASGTQSITINGIVSTGITKTISVTCVNS